MKITIIGAGNMGGSIARGLLNSKTITPYDITIAKFPPSNPDIVFKELGCKTTTEPSEACSSADIIILAVKPWLAEHVIRQIKPHVKGSIIISVMGGVSLETLGEHFSQALFRVTPNTATSICQSITFISSIKATDEQQKTVVDLFKTLGQVIQVDENKIEACTVLGSCGIAFAMRYVNASQLGAIEMGLTPSMAQQIISQTLIGTASLLKVEGAHPALEIERVTTPGGITIKGLNTMEDNGFSSSIIKGLKASLIK